jgi:hypothetical protein
MTNNDELERQKFEEWFKCRAIAMKSQGLGLITISRLRQKQWEAYRAAWNTRAEMEKSDD